MPKKPPKPPMPREPEEDEDELETVELTPQELKLEELKNRLSEIGGAGKADVYAVRNGRRIRRGTMTCDEILGAQGSAEKIAERFGGEIYEVDFHKPDGTFMPEGRYIRFEFDPSGEWGGPKNLNAPPGALTNGGNSSVEQVLREELTELRLLLNQVLAGGKGDTDKELARLKQMHDMFAPKNPGQVETLQSNLLQQIVAMGFGALRKQQTDPNAIMSPLEAMTVDLMKNLNPVIAAYSAQKLGVHSRPAQTPPNNGNGNGGEAVDVKKVAMLVAPQLVPHAVANLPMDQAANKVYEMVDKADDEKLYQFVSTPNVAAVLVAADTRLEPHAEWCAKLCAEIKRQMDGVPVS